MRKSCNGKYFQTIHPPPTPSSPTPRRTDIHGCGIRGDVSVIGPVSPVYFTRPGDPPSLVHRAAFDDMALNAEWRERREVVDIRGMM